MQIHINSYSPDVITYTIEIIQGNQKKIQQMQTLPIVIAQQFQSIALQFARDPRPCSVKVSWQDEFWSQIDHVYVKRERYVCFENIPYGDIHESKI